MTASSPSGSTDRKCSAWRRGSSSSRRSEHLGRLHHRRVATPAAVEVEVEEAGREVGHDPSPRRPGGTRPKYTPVGRQTTLAANRSPPTCEDSQTSSTPASSRARTTGRPKSAQHRSRRPFVQTRWTERPAPARRPRGARRRRDTAGRCRAARRVVDVECFDPTVGAVRSHEVDAAAARRRSTRDDGSARRGPRPGRARDRGSARRPCRAGCRGERRGPRARAARRGSTCAPGRPWP